jgi:predicted AAA+ superfamily ATPase
MCWNWPRIEQLHELPNLLHLLATRSGGLLNLAELSRASGLQQTTLKRYFVLLETLFLVHRLQPWDRNAGKRLVKTPKLYLPDSGLLSHLLGLDDSRLAAAPGLPGGLVESWVLGELLRHLAFSDRGLTLWHYRTQAGQEVDFVLENRQGELTGIEVKASATLGAHDFKGLRHLQETEPERFRCGYVLYAGQEVIPFGSGLWAVPLAMWCAPLAMI